MLETINETQRDLLGTREDKVVKIPLYKLEEEFAEVIKQIKPLTSEEEKELANLLDKEKEIENGREKLLLSDDDNRRLKYLNFIDLADLYLSQYKKLKEKILKDKRDEVGSKMCTTSLFYAIKYKVYGEDGKDRK